MTASVSATNSRTRPSLQQVNIVEELTEFAIARARDRLVDSGRRVESLRVSLSTDAARAKCRRRTRR